MTLSKALHKSRRIRSDCDKDSSKVIFQLGELRFAGTAFPKTMLEIIQYIVSGKMSRDVRCYEIFSKFANNTSQSYRTIV